MVVDTSALAAILFDEPDARQFEACLITAPRRLMSVVTRVELSCVIEGRKGEPGRIDLERLLQAVGFEIVSATPQHVAIAIDAFRRFGKGRHPVALNIGDCFAYAVAAATGEPLLFKGRDFSHTDIRSARPC